jgi:hypothetical protein
MPQYVRWQEERRTSRRSIADALEAAWQDPAPGEVLRAQIRIGPMRLPSGEWTALVDIIFPDLACIVSLPTSARFRARSGTSSEHQEFEIFRLDGAEVASDGSILLVEGTRLRAVEVIPTHLPYKPSELEERILGHFIALTKSYHCYRSIREGLPEDLQHQVPDLRALDYGRLATIEARPLKVIRAFIEDHDPQLEVSNQKIADTLAMCGIRVPRRRPRRAAARATI